MSHVQVPRWLVAGTEQRIGSGGMFEIYRNTSVDTAALQSAPANYGDSARSAEVRRAFGQLADWQPPATTQDAMHRFITNGMLDRHLRKVRRIYRERHTMVIDAAHTWHDAGLIAVAPNNHAGPPVPAPPRWCCRIERDHRAAPPRLGVSGLAVCTRTPSSNEGLLIGFGLPTSTSFLWRSTSLAEPGNPQTTRVDIPSNGCSS